MGPMSFLRDIDNEMSFWGLIILESVSDLRIQKCVLGVTENGSQSDQTRPR